MRTYTVTNVIAFHALYLPHPAGALIFWSQGTAGGVLLLPGIHYLIVGNSFVLGPGVAIAAGDTITVVG
jgi:hypothetical protein